MTAIGGAPAFTRQQFLRGNYSVWGDGLRGLRGGAIPFTGCIYNWVYPADGSSPRGDPYGSSSNLSPVLAEYVGWDASAKEWGYIRATEAHYGPTVTDVTPSCGCGGLPLRALHLGFGSKAFLVTTNAVPPPSTATYAEVYDIYALSKHHNIIELSAWPLSLDTQEKLVIAVLRMKKF